MNDDHSLLPRPLPTLSDEAVVEILDFLHHLIDAFETAYGDQMRRYYQDLAPSRTNAGHSPETPVGVDDPPF